MWPVSARYREALYSGQRRWATRIEVLYAGERVESLDLVVDGKVSIDDVAVRRMLDITVIDPDGALTPVTARDLLAPKGTEIRVWRGLWVDGDYEWVPLGVFRVINPRVTAHEGGTQLHIRGYDRTDAVKGRRFADPWRIAGGTPTHEAIAQIVASRMPTVPMRITSTGHTTPELLLDRLSDPWEAVRDLAQADGLTAYFDPLGTLIVTPELEQVTDVVYTPGPSSLLVHSEREIDAETTYSGVIVVGEHPDQDPIRSELWDLDPTSPTYADGEFGRRPYGFKSPIITTQAQADLAAATILPRVTKMRQEARLSTVGFVGHEIGDVVTITDPETATSGLWAVRGATVPTRAGRITLKLEEAIGA